MHVISAFILQKWPKLQTVGCCFSSFSGLFDKGLESDQLALGSKGRATFWEKRQMESLPTWPIWHIATPKQNPKSNPEGKGKHAQPLRRGRVRSRPPWGAMHFQDCGIGGWDHSRSSHVSQQDRWPQDGDVVPLPRA